MSKIIFGIFAHPDDEAFGPSGALYLDVLSGAQLHLITLTLGEAGTNPDRVADLGKVREQEWRAAGQLIGATSLTYLGFQDGKLDNRAMISAGQKIIELVKAKLADAPLDTTVEFVTTDLNGISGHIDHIVAARAACFAFYTLKASDQRLQRIRLACVSHTDLPALNIDWLFMEPGRTETEIDEVVDARQYNDKIRAIMMCHQTQRHDLDYHLEQRRDDLGLYYFMIRQ